MGKKVSTGCFLALANGLICDFCSSGQSFAAAFLQILPHGRHPWLRLYPSHCRLDSGLSPFRMCAHRAHYHKEGGHRSGDLLVILWAFSSVGLLAWKWEECGSRWESRLARIARNKQIIRTRLPLGRSGSDYIGLVPVTGLEPVRHRWRWILSPLRLPFHHTGVVACIV